MVALWERGVEIRTEYDRTDAQGRCIDPPSRDCTMVITVPDPFAEPRIHKNFPGGPAELEVYRQEVVLGIHDHWVDPADPDKWTYTYHERLFAYRPTTDLDDPAAPHLPAVDQIAYVLEKAAAASHSRRIQATTWMPTADPATDDPPCLQRLWFRLLPDDAGELVVNLNTHWRSRDAYKAWFMNAFALPASSPSAWAGPSPSAATPTSPTPSTSTAATSPTSSPSSRRCATTPTTPAAPGPATTPPSR